jgi:deoxycytidylate deaminase/dephospho-CoA kinase
MVVSPKATIIGFTGAFGSGCTTATKYLRDERGFRRESLSDVLRKVAGGEAGTPRVDLQRLGDQLREERGPGALVDILLGEESTGNDVAEPLVIDSIRNLGEIQRLREHFGYQFMLIAILATPEARWIRIGSTEYTDKSRSKLDFVEDDQRDKNEETEFGQQVELCIDEADIFIDNTGTVPLSSFKEKVLKFSDLATGREKRFANPDEIYMHMAFSSAHGSKCLKRNVGAVLVDERGEVVSVGYNENPLGTFPCVQEPTYEGRCYRDIVRNSHFETLSNKGVRCPICGNVIPVIEGPPWRCPSCAVSGVKTNLESFFFPDRAMTWCTAIHAEDRAILAAGERAAKARLYTTTFPCFQCAEKIANVGITSICFTEAYPDPNSADRLDLAGIAYVQFEGVRSSAFERLFPRQKG